MKRLRKTFLIAAALFSFSAQSQKSEPGKVSVKELEEKAYPGDTSAVAAITYKKGKSIFKYRNKTGFSLEHEYEFRIKIYKKEGLSWANFSVPYYTGYQHLNNDWVQFSDAVTYNLENGAVTKTKLGSEGRFKKDINELWGEASITMPNVKVGSVIEFKYTLKTEDISEFPVFYFQYGIPVKHCEYYTEIPQYFVYNPVRTGFADIKADAKIADGAQNFLDEYNHTATFSYKEIRSNYTADDIPALKDEAYVDNIQNYRASVRHELQKTRFPNVDEKNYATTWENVAQSIYKEESFGGELRQRQYFEPFIGAYAKGENLAEITNNIFDYVKRTMTWDNKYGYLTRKGVKQAFADKTGNAAEINLMLIAMLNYAGVTANPVLVSTVDNGVAVFPTRTTFNHVIAAAEIDGKPVLLDATSKNAAPGILPLEDLNWYGWLIRTNGTAEKIDLVPTTNSLKTVNMMAKISSEGVVSGKLKCAWNDYFGLNYREKYKGINTGNYLEKLESRLGGINISGYGVDCPDSNAKPVIETFDFSSANTAEVIGDKIYINPLLFFTDSRNPFLAQNRNLPVYYSFPKIYKYNISIEIPEGYAVESVPASLSLTTGQNVCFFTLNVLNQQNRIQITATEENRQAIVEPSFYDYLKEYYEKMIKLLNEKIVLKKL